MPISMPTRTPAVPASGSCPDWAAASPPSAAATRPEAGADLDEVDAPWCRATCLLPLPEGERGGVRGLGSLDDPPLYPPHPRPLPKRGEGVRSGVWQFV